MLDAIVLAAARLPRCSRSLALRYRHHADDARAGVDGNAQVRLLDLAVPPDASLLGLGDGIDAKRTAGADYFRREPFAQGDRRHVVVADTVLVPVGERDN